MTIKKIILIVLGMVFVTLGGVGIFLPVLPTTPFLLLSAACFSTSSPRLSEMLINNKYFGSYIENYRYKTGVPRKTKIRAIIFLWIGLLISMILVKKLLVTGILLVIGTIVTIHLSTLKNKE